jgi:RNA polymerase sigma factor (sigma-70 family)
MPEAENRVLPPATNDTWRTWLMTGARRTPIDRRRMRGRNQGLKRMLLEGMSNGGDRPHAWQDFSGAMIRHAVEEAMRTLPQEDKQVVKLAYFGGYSNRAIAAETGLTEWTVQRRLRRALAAISEHIQHGRALGRRAMYALMVWLSARWLTDTAHLALQAAVVAGATVIIVAQPPAAVAPPPSQAPSIHASTSPPGPVVPPLPSPAIPAPPLVKPPALQLPTVKLPIALPSPPVPQLRA